MDFNTYLNNLNTEVTAKIGVFINALHLKISILAAILVMIYITYKVILYMSNVDKGLDPYVIIRPCLVLAGIVLYQPLVNLFMNKPMHLISEVIKETIVSVSGGDITAFNSNFRSAMQATDSNIYDALQVNPILELIHLLIYFLGSFIANYMLIRQTVTLAIYYTMGYFSVMFSLIPGNEKAFVNWALSYLAVLMWEPFIYLIKFLAILTKIDSIDFQSFLAVVAIQIVIIFAIFKVPQFCEFIISNGSGMASPVSSGPVSNVKRVFGNVRGIYRSLRTRKK